MFSAFRKIVLLFTGLVLIGTFAGCGYNNIPSYDEQAKATWSQVLSQYQRRADLIPNLVETVQAYVKHERETLTAVTEARSKATQMTIPKDILTNPQAFQQFQKNQDSLGQVLSRLMVSFERYPDLKANQNFLALQSQIEGTENRISVERGKYIKAVQQYNTELRTFPGVVWKVVFFSDAKPMEQFKAEESTQKAPVVKFSK